MNPEIARWLFRWAPFIAFIIGVVIWWTLRWLGRTSRNGQLQMLGSRVFLTGRRERLLRRAAIYLMRSTPFLWLVELLLLLAALNIVLAVTVWAICLVVTVVVYLRLLRRRKVTVH